SAIQLGYRRAREEQLICGATPRASNNAERLKKSTTALEVRSDWTLRDMDWASRKPSILQSRLGRSGISTQTSPNNKLTSVLSRNSATGEIIMTTHSSNRLDLVTRRKFLGTTAAGSAALLTGGLTSLLRESASATGGFDFIEKTIPQLQAAMASGQLTSVQLTHGYIDRLRSLNPPLN